MEKQEQNRKNVKNQKALDVYLYRNKFKDPSEMNIMH